MANHYHHQQQHQEEVLCVKDKRKKQDGGESNSTVADANGSTSSSGSSGSGSSTSNSSQSNGGNNGADRPLEIDKAHIVRMASQYTTCAGCSAAVKSLLERPIAELRLLNAVMEETAERGVAAGDIGRCGGGEGGAGGGGAAGGGLGGGPAGGGTVGGGPAGLGQGTDHICCHDSQACGLAGALRLRPVYQRDRQKLQQLLESFPLAAVVKKVQPKGVKGVSLRCETHRRNAGTSSTNNDNWDWEDAWERLPAGLRAKVGFIDVAALETAMHQATATHRFCADCKHNVVTAFDVLTCKYDLSEIENDDEFNPELFYPFEGRVTEEVTGKTLCCPLEDVEELICWHEDFDSREYSRSSQRHAATLEHGQREIRSIVGSVLLCQLRASWHNHLAQVQGEQYLFSLVLHAVRTQLALLDGGRGARLLQEGGVQGGGLQGLAAGGASSALASCLSCGDDVRAGCPHCGGTGVSAAALDLFDDDKEGGDASKKSKSKKKKERKARAKARKEDHTVLDHNACPKGNHTHHPVAVAAPNDAASGVQQQQQQTPVRKGSGGGSGSVANASAAAPNGKDSRSSTSTSKSKAGAGSKGHQQQHQQQQQQQQAEAGCMMGGGGSLLAMLGGAEGDGDHEEEDEMDDIDLALMKEMEALKAAKAKGNTDVQASRQALRNNLQKNFEQLLVGGNSN